MLFARSVENLSGAADDSAAKMPCSQSLANPLAKRPLPRDGRAPYYVVSLLGRSARIFRGNTRSEGKPQEVTLLQTTAAAIG